VKAVLPALVFDVQVERFRHVGQHLPRTDPCRAEYWPEVNGYASSFTSVAAPRPAVSGRRL